MKRVGTSLQGAVFALAAIACASAFADFEVKGPDGRRILLKDDKTWSYVDAEPAKDAKPGAAEAESVAAAGDAKEEGDKKPAAKDKPEAPEKKIVGEALLFLDGKVEGNRVCRLQLRMVNNLPFEIRSLVPEFSVYRSNDVVYDSLFAGFSFIKPGDSQKREVRFNGINCQDIVRVKVGGGDRCEMGDLDKFSNAKGACLAHVKVEPSGVVRFDK